MWAMRDTQDMWDQELTEELHESIIKKIEKEKVH